MWNCSKQNDVYLCEYLNGTFPLLSSTALKVLNHDLVFRNGQFGAWSARKPITRDRTGQDRIVLRVRFIERPTATCSFLSVQGSRCEAPCSIRCEVYEAKVVLELLGMLVFELRSAL